MSGAGEPPPPGVPPLRFPVTPPPASADDLTQQFHEMAKKIAVLETQVTQIIGSGTDHEKRITDGQSDIHAIRRQIAFFRGAAWVIGALLAVLVTFMGIFLTSYLRS
jgi:hypothetical protein